MTSEFKRLLNKIEAQDIPIPKGFVDSVILKVNQKDSERSKVKTLGLGFVSMLSLIASIPIIYQVIASFTQSGIYNYLSLIFSDSDVIIVYWKEILVTLAESVPTISIISLLAILAVFAWSTLKAMNEAKKILITA